MTIQSLHFETFKELKNRFEETSSARLCSLAGRYDCGWERNFVAKKFRGIDPELFPLFRGRKHSFRGIPKSAEEPIPMGR
jgi:hypothetical protein